MPGQLRTRLRRAFTRGSEDEPGPLRRITSSRSSKKSSKTDSSFYQPGEKMPPLKYRRPVNPAHKEHLEQFNWSKAWRRRSVSSVYSPMGSRMPSRKSSYVSLGRRSVGRKSLGDRKASFRTDDGSILGIDSGVGESLAGDDRPELLREGSDEEGDVTNVGLSRNPTIDPKDSRRRSSSLHRRSMSIKSGTSRPATSDRVRRSSASRPKDGPLFAPEDLELALNKSSLDTTKEESDRSGDGTPGTPGSLQLRPRGGSVFVAPA